MFVGAHGDRGSEIGVKSGNIGLSKQVIRSRAIDKRSHFSRSIEGWRRRKLQENYKKIQIAYLDTSANR